MQFTTKSTMGVTLAATFVAAIFTLTACGDDPGPAPAQTSKPTDAAAPHSWSTDQINTFVATPGAGLNQCTGAAIAKAMRLSDARKVATLSLGPSSSRQDVLNALMSKYGADEGEVDYTQFFGALDDSGCPGTANG